jgi:CubicO group peptidase (beta-lactamase class C family)
VDAGLTVAGLEHLHAVAQAHIGDAAVPGLVALVAKGDHVHVETSGKLAVGGPPVTRDSIFRIASTTKPITAAATLAPVAEGLFDLAQKSHGGLGPDFFKGPSWGYGQSVLDSGAYGWDGGFGTTWFVDPTCDLTVIVLTQRMFETSEAPRVHRDIQAAAYAALS